MKTYEAKTGYWSDDERTDEDGFKIVTVDRGDGREPQTLPPRLDLSNHSPTGYAWGYEGSGPAQLALAILCCELGDDAQAVRLHQRFKRDVIAPLDPKAGWKITSDDVSGWILALEISLWG